jgi:hypothetical protein
MMGAHCFTACKCKDHTQGSPYLACSVNHSWKLLLVIEPNDRFKNGRKACNFRPRVLLFISCSFASKRAVLILPQHCSKNLYVNAKAF